ncbi:MAG TPA: bifunctional phosphoribosyl-AMP cyclohydrolase/phosphoribosyl-ATP diphosphatase HisIE [Roseiflexaceae bacterium]|nr:bifunctional phosphoribosyl-AMP cyclohydrolase/phosphoribosyl-ATP diphosphatase HisIE [Roseiflexaceae bacterium]
MQFCQKVHTMPTYNEQGLIPAIVQHARTGEVLMLGYMNETALQLTRERKLVTFWSRSRDSLWQKGETSGNVLHVVDMRLDCDGDAILVLADPEGPTCHTGAKTCFHRTIDEAPVDTPMPAIGFLAELAELVAQRDRERPEGSYTTRLLVGGVDRIGKKIGEEAAEVIIAAKNNAADELTWEVSDLLFHTLVLLQAQGLSLDAIWAELRRRHAPEAGASE